MDLIQRHSNFLSGSARHRCTAGQWADAQYIKSKQPHHYELSFRYQWP